MAIKDLFTLYIYNNDLSMFEAYDDFKDKEGFIKYLLENKLATRRNNSQWFFKLTCGEFKFNWKGEDIDITFCKDNTGIAIVDFDDLYAVDVLADIRQTRFFNTNINKYAKEA